MEVYSFSEHISDCPDGSEHGTDVGGSTGSTYSGSANDSNRNTGLGGSTGSTHSGTANDSNRNTGLGCSSGSEHSGSANDSNPVTGLRISSGYSSSECTTRSFSEITDKFTEISHMIANNEINQYSIPPNLNQENITQQILDEIAILNSNESDTKSASSGFHGVSCGSESSYLSAGIPNMNMQYKEILTAIALFESTLDEYIP